MSNYQKPVVTLNRNSFADLLKGLAVLFMIQIHITEFLSVASWQSSLAGSISMFLGGPPAAPVFLIVLGYFFASSRKTTKQKLLRGCKLIGGGFLLNLSLNASLLLLSAEGKTLVNPWRFIFGVDILFAAGLSTLFMTVLERYLKVSVIAALLFAVIAVQAGSLLGLFAFDENSIAAYFAAYIGGNYPWSYFPLFPWVAYPLTGYAIFVLKNKLQSANMPALWLQWSTFITGSVIIAATFTYGLTTSSILKVYYHHSLLFYFWTVCFLAVVAFPLYHLNKAFQQTAVLRYITWIGKQVTAFYVVQWIIIGNTATQIFKTQSPASLPFWFAGILLVSSLLVYLWEQKLRSMVDNLTEYLTQNG